MLDYFEKCELDSDKNTIFFYRVIYEYCLFYYFKSKKCKVKMNKNGNVHTQSFFFCFLRGTIYPYQFLNICGLNFGVKNFENFWEGSPLEAIFFS